MKRLLLILLYLPFFAIAQPQQLIDSLTTEIENAPNDSIKIDFYNKLAWLYIFNDKEKARSTIREIEEVASRKGQEFGYNSLLNVKGVFYDVNGLPDSAEIMFKKSLQFSRDNKFKVHEEHTLNNLGMFSWNSGNYKGALRYYFDALKLNEGDKDKLSARDANYNNIGLIYQDMELYDKSILYHEKALKIRTDLGNPRGQATSYSNLGVCYTNLEQYKKAEDVLLKGKKLAESGKDKLLYYELVEGLGELYAVQNKNDLALKFYEEAYNRPESVSFNPNRKVNILSGMASAYKEKGSYAKAISHGEEAMSIIEKDSTIDFKEVDLFNTLATSYFARGDSKKGNFYNQKFYTATSKKFKESTAEALQELETKYETQKKELALQKSEIKNKQKNMYIYSALGLAFLLGLIGYLVYKQQRTKNNQLVKENELKQALTKIENQNNLQEQRLDISKELHDNIGSQLTFIISSLDNLKQFDVENIELFNKVDTIGGFTRETITDLRDTIWAMNKEEITFEDLKDRTNSFLNRAKASLEDIDFQFNYPLEYEETSLSSKKGVDVYRIIQEAVNNAVKHAQATEIHVNFERHVDEVFISIADNGIGFDPAKATDGHGLHSMKNRADKIGADFDIESRAHGTKISLKFAAV